MTKTVKNINIKKLPTCALKTSNFFMLLEIVVKNEFIISIILVKFISIKNIYNNFYKTTIIFFNVARDCYSFFYH
jgi:hypothetical protein